MAELEPPSQEPAGDRGVLFYVGAGGLILVMLVETLAVIGRHVGWPILGAIEIIQAAILVSACAATAITTLSNGHATVHLLSDHVAGIWKSILSRLAAALSACFFAGLACGATWLAHDFWNAYEESEVLHISFRPLRALTALAVACAAIVLAYRSVRPRRPQ